jgi:hypothetical protein
MKRLVFTIAIGLAVFVVPPAAAQAEFGLNNLDLTFTNADGTAATQAGSHPFAMTTSFNINFSEEGGTVFPDGRLKDAIVEQIVGVVGDTTAYPRCSTVDFVTHSAAIVPNACPVDSVVGVIGNSVTSPDGWNGSAVFNLTPPPGVLLRLGFNVVAVDVIVDVSLKRSPPYSPIGAVRNTPEPLYVFASKLQLWGNPSDPAHDRLRGKCYFQNETLSPAEEFKFESQTGEACPVSPRSRPFLTMPTRCSGANLTSFAVDSWEQPGSYLVDGEPDLADPNWHTDSVALSDEEGNPQAFTGCSQLGFNPSISAKPTTRAAQSPTGLDFGLDVKDEGLTSITGRAQSDIKKAVVTLPEGMTANPSVAEGLEVCSEADLVHETVDSAPGDGCPEASKIGTIEVESPLVEEAIKGALYQAAPYENEFGSLLAFYFVVKNPKLGVIVKQAAKVEADPVTGQLIATTDDIPQLPFSHFKLHFREGGRSPLVSPPHCGEFAATAELTPWSGGPPVETTSSFTIISGPDERPCPPGGTPPFQPGFEAGSVNNAAGAYSPFYMDLTRRDGDQDLTRFDATLPPGVAAKLAGVTMCSDAQIAQAKAKTGRAELASPSCPASSKIGRVEAGAGVGPQLTYVPGSIYLAGPFGGAPLSVVAAVPAVAGPFDVGTVVTRQALEVNPRTGKVRADGAHSDPIPHILAGIPLVVRDIQVYVDRPDFTINPTSCDPFATGAAIWGGGANLFSTADDSPVAREARYQVANCSRLGFKPKLSLKLKGGTHRGAHPQLQGVFIPRPGDANLAGLVLRLPRSAFLDQAHIRTICTRVQFAAKACPAGAVYGQARAFTPLLDQPLEGPVYLRSSNHNLPDFVADLHGLIDVEAVARIDSKHGGIRATFTEVPDAPITKVVVNMQGGKKGLIVNSTNLCAAKHHANAVLDAHSGKRANITPLMQASCGPAHKRGQAKGSSSTASKVASRALSAR